MEIKSTELSDFSPAGSFMNFWDKLSSVLSLLERHSRELALELSRIAASKRRIEEIRIRVKGRSFVRISGCDRELSAVFSGDADALLFDLSGGSPFTARETLTHGYLTTPEGVRVGVIGRARYGSGELGISEAAAFVFRFPAALCPFAADMYREWVRRGRQSALITSPPGVGKTTALFSLVSKIAEGGVRTVLVDERCECDADALSLSGVDVMRGYKRSEGLEIAVRTMSVSVVACDEIYREDDTRAILSVLGSGVTVIASAHADTDAELSGRRVLRPLLGTDGFRTVFRIKRKGGDFEFEAGDI